MDNFILLNVVGEGTYSKVFKAKEVCLYYLCVKKESI